MTRGDAALEQIRKAQSILSQSIESWNGADLESVEKANSLLETSVTNLKKFHDAIASGALTPTPQMRSALLRMAEQIQQLTRIVDASSAFVQGLAVYAGLRSTTYNASGEITSGERACLIY